MHFNDLHEGAKGKIFQFARENRSKSTSAEHLLWINLRNRRLDGFKFRRQHPIQNYVADFYCFECKLVIEVDGGCHLDPKQAEYDYQRTKELQVYGIKVLRFPNDRVLRDVSSVLKEISNICRQRVARS